MKRSHSRIAAVAGFVGVLPALLIAAVLLFDFSVPIEGMRARVAAALTDALGCPVTIGGTLVLVTGTRPGLDGRDVRLGECRFIRGARASADEVGVRVSLSALFSHEIRLLEITGKGLEVEVPTEPPAKPASPSASGPSRWTFAGISRLYVAPARLLVRSAGAPPRSIDLSEIEGAARADKPMQLTLHGMFGQGAWTVSATTATLRSALAGPRSWPLDLTATYGEAKLSLLGSWSPTPIGVTGDLEFADTTPEKLFRAFGVDAPELGAMKMSGRFTASRERVALETMNFTGPVGALSGDVHVTGLDRRPMIDASLRADAVDYAALEHWRSAAGEAVSAEATFERAVELLRAFDADYSASVDRVTNAPFSASGVRHSATLRAGVLKMTSAATVDGAPSEVSLDVDARGPYAVEARASVKSLPRTALTQAQDLAGIDRHIGGLSGTFSAHGATLEALLKDAHGQLTGQDIRLIPPLLGGRREVRLRNIELSAGRGEAVRASAAGTLADEALELELVGGPLVDLLENRTWAVARLGGRIGAASIRANGGIEQPRTTRAARLDFELTTSRLDQLAPLLGGTELPRVPGSLRGTLDYSPDTWRIDATTIAIGATRGSGRVTGRHAAPIAASLDLQNLAGDELARIGKPASTADQEERSPSLPDLDLSLKARRASYRGQAFESIVVDARARDDAVRAPFSLEWSGAKLDGTLDATLGRKSMRLTSEATARGVDLARIPALAKRRIGGTIGRLTARVDASAESSASLAEGTAMSVEVADARVTLPKSDALPEGARFTFGGTASAPAGAPIDLSLTGAFRDKPIKLAGRLPPLDALYPAGKPYAVELTLDYDKTQLEANGTATIDNDTPKFSGLLKLSGDTLHTLADLAGFSARGFGPYVVSANLEADSKKMSAQDVAVKLGKSRFRASLTSTPGKARQRITAKVSGSPVHLEDIGAQALSPESLEAQARAETEGKEHGNKVDEAELARDVRVLTRVLRAFDFDLDVTLDELSAAGEAIGRAALKAKLADGVLEVKPISLTVGQGTFDAEIDVDVRGKAPRYALKFESNSVDYGPFLRAVDPKSTAIGTFDLSLDVKSSGAPERLLQDASGAVDILVLPKNQQAGRLDALGAGVLRLVMTTLDPRDDSRLNCIVGSFDLANGFATSRIVLLDTTRARVAGELVVDFSTRGLSGRLAPRSKRPELFSVVQGISITGTLDKPEVGVTARQVVVGMLNIWKVPLTFTADWLANRDLPEDGTPDCRAAYRHVLH